MRHFAPRSIHTFTAITLLLAGAAHAQQAKRALDPLDQLAFSKPETWVGSDTVEHGLVRGVVAPETERAADGFLSYAGGQWRIMMDRVTGSAGLVEGSGIPWIPGAGNGLALVDSRGIPANGEASTVVPRDLMVEKALAMVRAYPDLFGCDATSLQLIDGATGPVLEHLYFVDFRLVHGGVPVENAHVVFRVNHGNLVQFGSEYVSRSVASLDPKPYLDAASAWNVVRGYAGWRGDEEVVEPGRLVVMPVSSMGAAAATTMPSALSYRLVWVASFRRPGVMGTWEARVDAHSGELVQLEDVNDYGYIKGGVYVTDKTPTQTEVVRGLPFANYATNTYANAAGSFTGTTGTSTLSGKYVRIADSCGAISKAADGTGLVNFASSSGTDCTTPGSGGAGNTHSARTQYWNLTQIKLKGLTYLPSNSWLAGQLTANVNLNQTCNAYWNGSTVNFFKSGGGCGNTGELPGVSLHEWGHGMDQNDGNGSSPDNGSGEAYGDVSAVLQTHASCMGGGFLTSNCDGYGNACTSCTGVRDIDYAKHASQTPATPLGFNQTCPAASCKGPCNKECHCESAPPSQAVWDLATRDLVSAGMDVTSAWQVVDRLWYASRSTTTGMFVCGNNNSCNVGNLFNTFRVADDCNGNLADGTPNAGAIFNAFNRHQIACSSAVNTNNRCGCATLGTPSLTGTAGNGASNLSWAPITGAASYTIYKNEVGCTAGFTKLATVTTTSYADTVVANGSTYYYRIQANGSGSCPPSLMSGCATVTPAGGGSPDFTVGASPTTVTVLQGASGTSTITTSVSGGFNAAIALSVSGVPSGASGSFSPSSIPAPGSGTSTLTLNSGTAAAGTYALTVTATGGGLTRTASISFVVTAASGYPQSAHPYANNTNQTWSYTKSGAPASINVTFDPQTSVESGYDFIYVMDKNGVNIAGSPFTGNALAGATKTVTGDRVQVRLTSDGSVTAYGFKITNVVAGGGGGGTQQLLLNPGFESGTTPWVASTGVIDNSTGQPAHGGSWKAWMNGYGSAHTDTLYQSVTIPSTATSATLAFWLHIDTAESGTTAYDTLQVQVRSSTGTLLATLATYSNANAAAGYQQRSFNVLAYKGQTIRVHLVGVEDSSLQTSFVTDDYTLNVQ